MFRFLNIASDTFKPDQQGFHSDAYDLCLIVTLLFFDKNFIPVKVKSNLVQFNQRRINPLVLAKALHSIPRPCSPQSLV